MSGAGHAAALTAMLDRFCPMHVLIGATGHVIGGGPTLAKIVAPGPLTGARFLDLFELARPRAVQGMADLRALDGARLRLRLRSCPRYALKGQLCVLPSEAGGRDGAVMVINLAFGISVVDAVRDFGLSGADFAVTDLATEMLYLLEAKTVAMEESRRLNRRLEGARHAAQEQALTDTLTGLRNRRAFDAVLGRAVRAHPGFALLHLDLDFFKRVNDTHGHAAGDLVLRVAARRMLSVVRAHDVIARVGGDEFVLLLPGIEAADAVDTVAGRLIAALEEPVSDGGRIYRISASIGATLSPAHPGCTPREVMEAADRALYAAKAAGRGCYRLHGTPGAVARGCGSDGSARKSGVEGDIGAACDAVAGCGAATGEACAAAGAHVTARDAAAGGGGAAGRDAAAGRDGAAGRDKARGPDGAADGGATVGPERGLSRRAAAAQGAAIRSR